MKLILAIFCTFIFSISRCEVLNVSSAEYSALYYPLIEKIISKIGYTSNFQMLPAERSFSLLEKGEVDIEFFRQEKALIAFKDKIQIIGPAICAELVAFTKSESKIKITKLSDLRPYTVAYIKGNKIPEKILFDLGHTRATAVYNIESLYQMLNKGHVQIVLDTKRIGLMTIGKLDLQNKIKQVGPILYSIPSNIILRNKLSVLTPLIKKEFNKMKESKEWINELHKINKSLHIPINVGTSCL